MREAQKGLIKDETYQEQQDDGIDGSGQNLNPMVSIRFVGR